jgi:hypothetical protein
MRPSVSVSSGRTSLASIQVVTRSIVAITPHIQSSKREELPFMQLASRYCPACGRQGVAVRSSPNHVLHLLLTILTVGFWFPVWLLLAILGGTWNCQACGTRTYASRFDRFVTFLVRVFIVVSLIGLAALALMVYHRTPH